MAQVTIYALLPKYFYRPQRTLQTIALSSYERQRPVGFFSLPMEIRDRIMKLFFGRWRHTASVHGDRQEDGRDDEESRTAARHVI